MSNEDELKKLIIGAWYDGLTAGLETARSMVEAVRTECLSHLSDSENAVLTGQIAITDGLSESLLEAEAEVHANGREEL